MTTHAEFIELAELCLAQAHGVSNQKLADALRCMAKEYERQAAAIDGGTLPEMDGNAPNQARRNRCG
jgi:hypothetical protein